MGGNRILWRNTWFVVLAPLVAGAILFFLFRPEPSCVRYPDGRPRVLMLGLFAWPDALLAAESGECDPWDKLTSDQPIGAILATYSFETGAQPTQIAYLVEPDGNGYRLLMTGAKDIVAPATVAEAKALRGSLADFLVFFNDKAVYASIRESLTPLRDYSENVEGAAAVSRYTVACGDAGSAKAPLYRVDWQGEDEGDPTAWSIFSSADCAASKAARERIIAGYTQVSRLNRGGN